MLFGELSCRSAAAERNTRLSGKVAGRARCVRTEPDRLPCSRETQTRVGDVVGLLFVLRLPGREEAQTQHNEWILALLPKRRLRSR